MCGAATWAFVRTTGVLVSLLLDGSSHSSNGEPIVPAPTAPFAIETPPGAGRWRSRCSAFGWPTAWTSVCRWPQEVSTISSTVSSLASSASGSFSVTRTITARSPVGSPSVRLVPIHVPMTFGLSRSWFLCVIDVSEIGLIWPSLLLLTSSPPYVGGEAASLRTEIPTPAPQCAGLGVSGLWMAHVLVGNSTHRGRATTGSAKPPLLLLTGSSERTPGAP